MPVGGRDHGRFIGKKHAGGVDGEAGAPGAGELADRLDLGESKARGLSIRGIARFDGGDVEGGMADLRESVEQLAPLVRECPVTSTSTGAPSGSRSKR